jgi:hypothetical protein
MDDFEKQVTQFMQTYFFKGSKNWRQYEYAKTFLIDHFNPNCEQYKVMIKIITDWLEL